MRLTFFHVNCQGEETSGMGSDIIGYGGYVSRVPTSLPSADSTEGKTEQTCPSTQDELNDGAPSAKKRVGSHACVFPVS